VNPAFDPTAIPAIPASRQAAAWTARSPRAWVRALQASGAALAMFALALAALATLDANFSGADLPAWALGCAVAALGALRGGAWLDRRWAERRGLVDTSTGLYNRMGLIAAGSTMLRQSRADGKSTSLVVLDFNDLLEVRSIYGRETSRKLHMHVVRKMKAIAGAHGLAARTGKAQFTILLPGAGAERAGQAVQRVLGRPSRIEFDAGDCEVVLVPDVMWEVAAPAVETVDELYTDVVHMLAEGQRREQRRQHWLTRERERHSRPMSLPPSMR
jgi:GGDEF domain-containing protein